MKPFKFALFRSRAVVSVIFFSHFAVPSASAATFYWDSTSPASTAGFGNAAGSWAQNSTPGSGRWTTSSVGTASGSATQTTSGTDLFNFGTAATGLGAGTVTVNAAGVTMGNTNYGSASGAILLTGGPINFRADATVTVNNTANTINSVVGGAATRFTKAGTGKLTLGGANTYAGTTNISGGTLALGANGSLASPTLIVGASTTFDVSAVTGGYTLAASQTLSGTGTVTGAMSVSGTLSPGNSPGTISTGSQAWLNGGDYNLQVLDATGVAGTGFDQVAVTGTLDLSSLTADGFSINLWSLASTDANGNALNFDNTTDQSWTILTTSGGITGFDAADFIVNIGANNGTGSFSNELGGGAFSLGSDTNNLVLNFAAVPEPSAAALLGLGALAMLRRRR